MRNYSSDFESFDGKIWLNSASEGALPRCAAQALQEALVWKLKPYELTHRRFREVPRALKAALGRLTGFAPEDIILGSSATYGWDCLARAMDWTPGDEIAVMEDDFPVDILPWLPLERKGVRVRQCRPAGPVLSLEEIEAALTERTRLLCLSHVHTFTGHPMDPVAVGQICRERGIKFCLNITQSCGCLDWDWPSLPVDAVTCSGFKWLLGPYGTGFSWVEPSWRQTLFPPQNFWPQALDEEDLKRSGPLRLPDRRDTSLWDCPGTANFFNFVPWTASLNYLNALGMKAVHDHNRALVRRLLSGLNTEKYVILSPMDPEHCTGLVVFSCQNPEDNGGLFQFLLRQGIYPALWKGRLRFSPHVINTEEDIDRVLEILNDGPGNHRGA